MIITFWLALRASNSEVRKPVQWIAFMQRIVPLFVNIIDELSNLFFPFSFLIATWNLSTGDRRARAHEAELYEGRRRELLCREVPPVNWPRILIHFSLPPEFINRVTDDRVGLFNRPLFRGFFHRLDDEAIIKKALDQPRTVIPDYTSNPYKELISSWTNI